MTSAAPNVRGVGHPLKPVEALAMLVARLRDCAREAERLPLQRELGRIADELIAIRNTIVDSDAVTDMVTDAHRPGYDRDRRAREKNPEPGMRRCSKCSSVLPVDMFTVTDAKTGKRRADCKVCYNTSQRDRYVRAGYKIVTVEVLDGDPCVGHPCPECGQPFEPGQHVQGENVRHRDCRMARLESGGGPTPALCRACGGPFMAEDEGHQFCSEQCVADYGRCEGAKVRRLRIGTGET